MTPPANGNRSNDSGPPPWAGPPNDSGLPPWAGPPDHVTEEEDGTITVGKKGKEKTKEKAFNSDDQMDRIEAKLDLLLTELTDRQV